VTYHYRNAEDDFLQLCMLHKRSGPCHRSGCRIHNNTETFSSRSSTTWELLWHITVPPGFTKYDNI